MLFRSAAVLAAGLALAGAAHAQSAQQVAVDGCVSAGAQPSCLMVTTADSKQFDISVAGHKPEAGRSVHVTGMASDRAGACGQGTRLVGLTWTYTRQQCPAAK